MSGVNRLVLFVAVAVIALAGGYFARIWMDLGEPRQDPAEVLLAATLDDLAGEPQRLSQWRGKVMVVNFWATWCPPCLKEIPEFIGLQQRYGARGVQFVGVAIDDKAKVAAFVAQHGVNYPIVMAEKEGIALARNAGNRLGGLPFTVIIDRQGRTARVELGVLDEKKLVPILEGLL
ncbi:MAG: TlpA family protein disulfide reductase [Betaproteobacteria bacterium]|nr:MAG: TlpA family protein disulfide reductase [Betaproteobacteria bacterium]